MEEVDPNFVMATLICLLDAQHAERDCEGSMHADLPFILGSRRFKVPHTSDHSPDTPPGPHKGVETGGTGKHVLAKASSIILMGRGSLPGWRRHAAPLKSPATMSTCPCGITVRTVERHHGKVGLAIARYPSVRSTGDDCLWFPS